MKDDNKLKPVYDFLANPQRILLNSHLTAVFSFDETNYSGNAEVYLLLAPRPRIQLYANVQAMAPERVLAAQLTDEEEKLSFELNGQKIPGFLVRIDNSDDNVTRIEWSPQHEPIVVTGDESTNISHIIFHVFNFQDFKGTRRSVEIVERARYRKMVGGQVYTCDTDSLTAYKEGRKGQGVTH